MRELNRPALTRSARSLSELAALANAAVEQGEKKLVEAGKALWEAKAKCKATHGHGHWLTWLAQNFRGSRRTAARLMRAAKWDTVSHLGELLDAFDQPISESEHQDDTPVTKSDPSLPFDQPPATPSAQPAQTAETEKPDDDPRMCFQCRRRQRTGQPVPQHCKDCRELRVKARQDEPAPWEEPDAPKAPEAVPDDPVQSEGEEDVRPVDAAGVVIPERVRGAIACTAIADDCQTLMDFSDSLDNLCKAPGGGFVAETLEEVRARLHWCRDALMAKRTPYVCPNPDCRGLDAKCALCRGVGAVTRELYA